MSVLSNPWGGDKALVADNNLLLRMEISHNLSTLSLSYEEYQGIQIQINHWKHGFGKWLVFVSAFFKVFIFTPLDNCPHVYGSPTFVEGAR